MTRSLPERLAPMLCRSGKPFDSAEHLFEVKWDGVRAVAFVDGAATGHRLQSRHRGGLRARYPELEFLATLPPGLVLDGELVVLREDGRPDFPAMLSRENARTDSRITQGVRDKPVVFVVFDVLYENFEPLLECPLQDRRDRLTALVGAAAEPRLMLSDGIPGSGLQLFEAVRQRGLEGIVAKRLDSRYRPGDRSDDWLKIKPSQIIHCAVLGYEPAGERDFKSLLIASDLDGDLRYVGKVGTGFTVAQKQAIWERLQSCRRATPWLDAEVSGCFVEPGLYCSVRYLERMASGSLRAPVFVEWIEG